MIPGREQLKRIYFVLLSALGAEGRILRKVRRSGDRLIVLNLHQVRPEANPYCSPLHPRLFENLLRFIAPRFRVTTFARLHESGDPRPPLVLSFDDGYYDYLEYAVPLLRKYGFSSNQNVVANSVLTGRPPWTVLLSDFLGQAPRTLIGTLQLPGFALRLRDDSVEQKVRFGTALSRFIKMRPRAEAAPMWQVLEHVLAKLNGFRPSRMMTAAEVRQAAGEHEIGSHSAHHDTMEFESTAFFEQDFEDCVELFRDSLQLPLRIYAFPNGSWRPDLVDILRRREVEHILLVGEAYASLHSRVYPRFTFYGSSPAEIRLRALGLTPGSSANKSAAPTVPHTGVAGR